MDALTIPLPDDQAHQLRDLARRLGTSAEDLAAEAVRERLARDASEFDAVAARVMEKNAELYRRLA